MTIQRAGNDSTQLQVDVLNVYNGITEERAREIYREEYEKIIEFTQEAKQTTIQRVCELENRVIPKITSIEKGLEFFSNPDFQFLLIEAQKTAARSERPTDYDLLSELLIHRVKNDTDREKRLGIKKAVEIVDSISDEALLGLTILHSVSTFTPTSGDMNSGLDVLNGLFEKLLYAELPTGGRWLDHLDLLGTIRVDSFQNLKPICEFYSEQLDGYVCAGISKESEDFNNAINILASINVSKDFLVDNIINPGFVRLNIPNQNSINTISRVIEVNQQKISIPLSEHEIAKLKEILLLYNKDKKLIQNVKQRFSEEWEKRKTLRLLKKWWDKIPHAVTITEVGKVLAHANAQRCDNSLPPLN